MSEFVKTFVYLVIGAGFVLAAWIARPETPQREVIDDRGEPFFPSFEDPLAAASLEIVTFDEETGTADVFKVARHDGVWSIPSHANYPADAENRFGAAVAQLIGVEKGANRSDSPADHELYGVVDPVDAGPGAQGVGTRVTVAGDGGRALADLIVGKPVKDSDGQHYARVPGLDRVYQCAIDMEKFSTDFGDWIEKDLLDITTANIAEVVINDYSIDEFSGQIVQGELLKLGYDSEKFEWRLGGLAEGEELDKPKLNALRRALDDLKIVDVRRKPAGLSSGLRAEDQLRLDSEALQSLQSRGFFVVQGRLLSNQGETLVRMKDGIEYTLRFGEVVAVPGSGDGDDEDSTGRYLFVTASFNEDLVPKPETVEMPDFDALIPPEAPDAEGQEAEDPSPARAEAIELAEQRITEQNQRKQAEYDEKIESGRRRARELNDRFADWYYVISDSVYDDIRLRRGDIVKAKEQETAS